MSTLRSNLIEPLSGTTVTLGASGDSVTVPTGATVKTNSLKDAGGNVLWTSDGAGNLSSVNSAFGGSIIFISSQTASSSSSISFTTGIDSTYSEYMFVWIDVRPATNDVSWTFNGSDDTSSHSYNITKTTTLFNAGFHLEADSSAGSNFSSGSSMSQGTGYQRLNTGIGNDAHSTTAGVLQIFNPSHTVFTKHFYSRGQNYSESDGSYDSYMAGYFNTTAAITAIDFKFSSGDITAGKVYMYGIK